MKTKHWQLWVAVIVGCAAVEVGGLAFVWLVHWFLHP